MRRIGMTIFFFAAGLLSGVYAVPASASENGFNNLDELSPDLPDDNMVGNLLWVTIALIIVIGLIVVFIKFLSQRNRTFGANRSMRSLGGVALGQNKSMQVVEFAGRIYVVGVGEDILLLDKIDDESAAEQIIAYMEQQTGRGFAGFSMTDMIQKFRNRQVKEEPNEQLWNPSSSFQEQLQDKLERQANRKQRVEAALKDAKQTDRLMDK